MHRLDRRIRILREKRAGAFDRDQYYLERALRSRAARKVRVALRRMQPVVLITPRWSQAQRFLDDVGVDLLLGRPEVKSRTLSVAPLAGRNPTEIWAWLIRALVEFTGVYPKGRIGRQAVDRLGFRTVLRELLGKARTGPRRALMVHGVENLPIEARDDFIGVFEEYVDVAGPERRLNLLMACSVDTPTFDILGGTRVHLSDFSPVEALEALVEYLGPTERARLASVVDTVGGVPALLHALGSDGERTGTLVAQREEIWRALGPLADEIRGAIDIVSADDDLAGRLEEVAKAGPVPRAGDVDDALVRAGLIQELETGRPGLVEVRAPVFAELALAG